MSLQLSEGKDANDLNRMVNQLITNEKIFRNTRAIALHNQSNSYSW